MGTGANWRTASVSEFLARAVVGPAYCRIEISQMIAAAQELSVALSAHGVPGSAMADLFNGSLLAVCPECRQHCAGSFLLSLAIHSATGARRATVASDRRGSGPRQRLLGGRCGTPGCANRDAYHLFWCADLHPEMQRYLDAAFGIAIESNARARRARVWQPK